MYSARSTSVSPHMKKLQSNTAKFLSAQPVSRRRPGSIADSCSIGVCRLWTPACAGVQMARRGTALLISHAGGAQSIVLRCSQVLLRKQEPGQQTLPSHYTALDSCLRRNTALWRSLWCSDRKLYIISRQGFGPHISSRSNAPPRFQIGGEACEPVAAGVMFVADSGDTGFLMLGGSCA